MTVILISLPLNIVLAAGKPAIGGEWSLVDLDGNLVTNKTFAGKWTLLYFGFARCPDICPSEMVKIGKVMDTLKEEYPEIAKQVKPLFVSVDPARDSLKALREYGKDFHPSYIFLTGSPEQVRKTWYLLFLMLFLPYSHRIAFSPSHITPYLGPANGEEVPSICQQSRRDRGWRLLNRPLYCCLLP